MRRDSHHRRCVRRRRLKKGRCQLCVRGLKLSKRGEWSSFPHDTECVSAGHPLVLFPLLGLRNLSGITIGDVCGIARKGVAPKWTTLPCLRDDVASPSAQVTSRGFCNDPKHFSSPDASQNNKAKTHHAAPPNASRHTSTRRLHYRRCGGTGWRCFGGQRSLRVYGRGRRIRGHGSRRLRERPNERA